MKYLVAVAFGTWFIGVLLLVVSVIWAMVGK